MPAPKRRANGDGGVSQRPDGRWQGRIRINDKRHYVYGQTQGEAATKLRALASVAAAGRSVNPSKLTVGEYLTDWLDAVKPSLRPSTVASYQQLLRLHVLPSLGSVRLQAVMPLNLARLYSERAKSGISGRRCQMVASVLSKAFSDAVKLRLLTNNPAKDVPIPRHQARERRIWSLTETRAFMARVQMHERTYDALWLIALASGCRIGELLGIRWDDVDYDAGTINITRTMTFVNNRPIEGEPKTKAGRRVISLPSFAVQALRQHKARMSALRLMLGDAWQGESRIFTTRVGTVPMPTHLRREFRATCRAAGVPEMRIHDLRAMHATLSIHSGASVKAVQRRLGHASLAMTLSVYARSVNEGDQMAADGIERLLVGLAANS